MTGEATDDGAAASEIRVAHDALVVLIGASGSGKSTFAARHFAPTEIVSSDALRAMIADDAADQRASGAAFELLHDVAGFRLERGRLTVIDATNVDRGARRPLVQVARRHGRPVAAIVLHPPLETCEDGNAARPGRRIPPSAVVAQHRAVGRSLDSLREEGFAPVVALRSRREIDAASISRHPPAGRTAVTGAGGLPRGKSGLYARSPRAKERQP